MQIIQFFLKNPLRNFNYIIYSETTRKALIIDPYDFDKIKNICSENNLDLSYLINTHAHHDHIRDNERVLAEPGVELIKLKHLESFDLSENEKIIALDTPGHMEQHQCFLLEQNEKKIGIISGDTIFNAGIGNCKNGGNIQELFNSISFLNSSLSDEMKLYPSHDYMLNNLAFALTLEPKNQEIIKLIEKREKMDLDNEFIITDIALEKKVNPFLRVLNDEFQGDNYSLETKELFIKLRQLRDNW